MRIAVLGTGSVGRMIGGKLAELGHEVVMGTREVPATSARAELDSWRQEHPNVELAAFGRAAERGEVVINATNGAGSLAALGMAGEANLNGKVLVDISNPLDFSQGMPPFLSVCNTDSLGEQIQRAFPKARVVKTLNTVTASLMVDPGRLGGGDHTMFLCGNDAAAKAQVDGWLREWFGWRDVIDLGDITSARGAEMWLPIWLRLWGALGTGVFNVKVVR